MRTLKLKTMVCCLLFVASCSSQPPSQAPPTAGTVVLFEGARLITGDGGASIEDSAFLVENDRFTRVGKKSELELPDSGVGAVRLDLTGKTVMPAMIDLHAHLGYMKGLTNSAENYTRENLLDHLNRYAYFGVAAGVSLGSDWGDLPFQLRDEPYPGAALFRTAGRGLATPDDIRQQRHAAYGVTTEDEARKAVQELAAQKVDIVKIWVDDRNGTVQKLSPPLYRAIIDEAHTHNLRVVAHIYDLADAKDLVRSGIDGFAHLVRDEEVDDELLALLKERPYVFFLPNMGGPRRATYGGAPPWLEDPLVRETVSPEQIKRLGDSLASRTPEAVERSRAEWSRMSRNLDKLNRGGVRIGLGTDAGGTTGDQFIGWTAHTELENMVAAGMTPAQALVAATRTSAEILGLDDLGMVAVGKSADFVVLDANPLDDITNSRRIAAVYLRGKEVDRAALRAAWSSKSSQ